MNRYTKNLEMFQQMKKILGKEFTKNNYNIGPPMFNENANTYSIIIVDTISNIGEEFCFNNVLNNNVNKQLVKCLDEYSILN